MQHYINTWREGSEGNIIFPTFPNYHSPTLVHPEYYYGGITITLAYLYK